MLKRIIHRLRTRYNCAVGEVDDQDLWQSSVLAVVTVYAKHEQVESLLTAVGKELSTQEDFEVLMTDHEYL